MKKELAEQFSREVDNYRKMLLSCAQRCDWKGFEAKAGRLFDYCESIEFRELERRFFRIFNVILGILVAAVVIFFSADSSVHQTLPGFKQVFILAALSMSSYELYFLLGYRSYTEGKSQNYKRRREIFIRQIERDFRGYAAAAQTERKAA